MTAGAEAPDKLRIDRWLWHARFFRTRQLAGKVASSGRVRVNGARIAKAAHAVRPGDVLTFAQARVVRVIRVRALGTRRGPATEAQTLYDDLDPPSGASSGAEPGASPRAEPDAGRAGGADGASA